MNTIRQERGSALITTIFIIGILLTLGFAMLSRVDAQTGQTRAERAGETAFNLAEATLNAQAFLLGRNWPSSGAHVPDPASPAAPCSGQTLTGTLDDPAPSATPSPREQIQDILAQTYKGAGGSAATWWVTACEEGGRTAWDASLLAGRAYDPSLAASPAPRPRRMWVRAEAHVGGHRRAVVALVQAGQAPIFPSNLAVVTGRLGADLATTLGQPITGSVVGPLLADLTGGGSPLVRGPIGLRCSLLDDSELAGCLMGLYKATSMTTVAPLLQANDVVEFRSDETIRAGQLARLRQQAQASGTYYGTTPGGGGSVAAGDSCIPAGSAGKVIFIEQVGDGTGTCVLDTAGNPSAAAVIVGSGAVSVRGGGTFTGVVYALHRRAPAGGAPDVRISEGSRVVGGVFVDDNPALEESQRHGTFEVVPPPIDMRAVFTAITSTLPLCKVPITGRIICNLTTLLGGSLDAAIAQLGITPATLAAAIRSQVDGSLPAVSHDPATVAAVVAMGDSAAMSGTFRRVAPSF